MPGRPAGPRPPMDETACCDHQGKFSATLNGIAELGGSIRFDIDKGDRFIFGEKVLGPLNMSLPSGISTIGLFEALLSEPLGAILVLPLAPCAFELEVAAAPVLATWPPDPKNVNDNSHEA